MRPSWNLVATRAALVALVAATACAPRAPGRSAAPAAPPRLSADDVRADLAQLYTTLQQAHYDLYARTPRDAYDARYAATRAAITGPETPLEVALRFQRFVAFGRIAHARVDAIYAAFARYLADGGVAFPLLVRVVGDRVYVTDNRSGLAAIARGDELLALDGQPIAAWLARAYGDLSADTPYLAGGLLEDDLPMVLWLELGSPTSFAVTLRRGDAAPVDLTLPARTDAAMKAAAQAEPPVLALDYKTRTARMVDGTLAYLRPGPFYNAAPDATDEYDNTQFRTFIDDAFRDFIAAGATAIVIDLRNNPGGDSSFSDIMVGWFATRPFAFESSFRIKVSAPAIAANQRRLDLEARATSSPTPRPPSASRRFADAYARARIGDTIAFEVPPSQPRPAPRFTGKVYVLINRHTYSNAVAVAATIQDAHLGVIFGEETSDLATTYGAMETFTLDHSGLVVGFPKAYIVRPSGDLEARGVVPDRAIETPIVETADDPVLQRAFAIARGAD
ncbi:MAG: S41 family peptidase [Deltaproteobacteria bacterium]|nr:S41 family peptidase [Deltaproteobacteria bacterium]